MSNYIDDLLKNLEKDDMTEEQISELMLKVKDVQKKLKEKNKPKTITISAKDHQKIKKYCTMMDLNIGDWSSKVLLDEIEKSLCVEVKEETTEESEERIKKESENLIESWKEGQNRPKNLYKLNRLIISSMFKFCGYSGLDCNPIYEFTGKDLPTFEDESIKIIPSTKFEISDKIKSNEDLEQFDVVFI